MAKPGRKPIGEPILVRLAPEDERLVRQLAHDRRTQVSPLLRTVIKRWLSEQRVPA